MSASTGINYLHAGILLGVPSLALYGILTTPLMTGTFWFSVFYYFFTGLGITAGYHRLWAHKAFKASWPLEAFLAFGGAGAMEGSIRWWCRDHRAHHRYSDTDKDPYSVTKGFLWAHVGWMFYKQDIQRIGRVDIKDLNENKLVRFQHKYYLPLALFFAFVLPTLVCWYLFGDARGGFFYAGALRLLFVHHSTFFVNSLAHYLGERTYSASITAVDSVITAFLTLGEGYHNFHHEYPNDYRNAVRFYQYDPTKWFIRACSFLGLAYDLQMFPHDEIMKSKLQVKHLKLTKEMAKYNWGPEHAELPSISMEEVHRRCNDGEKLVVIDGHVHDVAEFMYRHPAGLDLVSSQVAKDASALFNGGVYNHSNAARNILNTLRVAKLE